MTTREAVRRGFSGLTDFSGRDGRPEFWIYALVVVVGFVIISNAVSFPLIAVTTFRDTPEAAFVPLFVAMVPCVVALGVLLAAAVSRRLHDRGHRGGWATLPLAALVTGLILMAVVALQIDQDPDPTLFLATFGVVLAYFALLAVLVVQLVLPGKPEENRWGPA